MDTLPARPITAVVPVDYQVQGCPASLSEFVKVFECILTGQEYHPPNDPVCVECKLRDNLCVLEKGTVCLGPVTRCGCDAICTTYGDACQGCRGLVDQPNVQAALDALTVEQRHSIMAAAVARNRLTEEEVLRKVSVYNDRPRKELEEK
jgi:coenzyme F420-reducing hydrogenase gamma subunit